MALKRKAKAKWTGTLTEGEGRMNFGSYTDINYSFASRFENGEGTNPEEMIGAAHAGCFSMAFNVGLEKAGFHPRSVATEAEINFEKLDGGWEITGIQLNCDAEVPEIAEDKFQEIAQNAKAGCPMSKALASIPITLNANLKQ